MRSLFYSPSDSNQTKKSGSCHEYIDLRFKNPKAEYKFVQTFYLQQQTFMELFTLILTLILIFAIYISSEYLNQMNDLAKKVSKLENCVDLIKRGE